MDEYRIYYVFNEDWQCCGIINNIANKQLEECGFYLFEGIDAVNAAYKAYCDYFTKDSEYKPIELNWANIHVKED